MTAYSANNRLAGTQQVNSATYITLMSLTAQTTGLRRFNISELDIAADGTPGDTEVVFDVSRQTVAGTGTAITPNPVDPAQPACATVGLANLTAEPTVTALSSVLTLPINQRATFRWIAVPGSELVAPATNLAGFAIRSKSASYTGTGFVNAFFNE